MLPLFGLFPKKLSPKYNSYNPISFSCMKNIFDSGDAVRYEFVCVHTSSNPVVSVREAETETRIVLVSILSFGIKK